MRGKKGKEEQRRRWERRYLYPRRKERDLLPGGVLCWAVGLTISPRPLFGYAATRLA